MGAVLGVLDTYVVDSYIIKYPVFYEMSTLILRILSF